MRFLLVLTIVTQCVGQEQEAIMWKPDLKLSWPDFKARPASRSGIAAITASGISYEFSTRNDKDGFSLDFSVNTYFYPEKSWYQPDVCDLVVLSHEQLHFDISELFARKFRDILNKKKFTRNVKSEVQAIFKKINKELAEFQEIYDEETNYSRDREQQMLWNRKIAEALLE